jgi:CRP-like cAMP-binding protein
MTTPQPHDLALVGPFTHLDEASRSVVSSWFQTETFAAGEVVVGEDDGKAFFVLATGSAVVTLDGAEVARLEPGDFFGEMSILYSPHRVGTVTAESPVTVWAMFGTRHQLAAA